MTAYNPKKGQTIRTDANSRVDRAFVAHFHVDAADAVATDTDGVLSFTNQGAAAVTVTTGITNPAVPRNAVIDGSASNIAGNVVINGTNFNGDTITETIPLNGTTAGVGAKAFKTITSVVLPIQTNTPAKQKATVTVSDGADGAGNEVFTFTAAALGDDSPLDVTVALAAGDDTAAAAAIKIVAALNANETFAEYFVASASTADIIIESLTYATQDPTIALTVKTAGTPNVALGSIAVDTVSGMAVDQISVGWGDIFGLPYLLYADELVFVKLFDKVVDTGTVVADDDEIENNTFDPTGTPDGLNDIDLYILV